MKPPPLRYERATTVLEALEFLAAEGEDAKVLAGGQSLVALLNLRLARPEVVLDIGPLSELCEHRVVGEDLVVGALVTQRQLELDPRLAGECPLLATAIPYIAHTAIRNRGTVGGSVAHGDAAAETPVVLAALGGSVTLRSVRGERRVAAEEFFRGFLTTAVAADELVTEVRFPVPPGGTGTSFVEFARRPGDFALVSVACVVEPAADGGAETVVLALGGIDSVPVRVLADRLGGAEAADATAAAVEAVDAAIEPTGDIHGSAEYRRHLARRLTARAVASAFEEGRSSA